MAGIDDYCSGNRNLLGADLTENARHIQASENRVLGQGYEKCLRLIQALKPTHIFNCHVNPAFDFTDDEIACMLDTLAEREKCYTELFPWDHANYGMDEHWVRCYPYEQEITPGGTAQLRVEVTNHSFESRTATAQPILPASWGLEIGPRETTIPPRTDGYIDFSIPIPVGVGLPEETPKQKHPYTASGRVVIPVDITYNGHPLGQFREAIFVLTGG